ncbi:MAG: peptidoglycan-binding protein [Clostridia bacterium]|nr:peptidoglycan-binding protein [Clostridia bacterium]
MRSRTRLNWRLIIFSVVLVLVTAGVVTWMILDRRAADLAAMATPTPSPALVTSAPSPTPRPTPSPELTESPVPTVYPTVRKGDRGDLVMIIQQRLINLGYLTGRADGDFGSRTQQALKDYQAVQGLEEDGIAGPKTMIHLFDGSSIPQATVYHMPGDTVYHLKPYCPLVHGPEEIRLSDAVRQGLTECPECR